MALKSVTERQRTGNETSSNVILIFIITKAASFHFVPFRLHANKQLSKTPSAKLQRSCCWVMAGREKEAWTCGMAYCRGQGVCLCVCVLVLLATLHVIATDPKVTDHPNCVFTHFIIYHHTDQ